MKPAGHIGRRARRVLVLGVLVSLALHLLLLVALHGVLRPPAGEVPGAPVALVLLPPLVGSSMPRRAPEPVTIPPPAPPALPAPAAPPAPAESVAGLPPPAEPAQATAGSEAANEGVDDAHQAADAAASRLLADIEQAALLARQHAAEAAAAVVAPPGGAPAPALSPAMQAALADMPADGEVDYQVNLGGGDFKLANGTLRWRIEGLHYHIDLTAQAVGLARLFKSNVVSQISEGHITANGLAPDQFRVLGRLAENSEEAARFDWAGGHLVLQPSGQALALPDGTQDLLSFFMQFALLPPSTDSMLQPVTNGRKLDRYAFEMTERGPLQLPVGRFQTVHITKLHASNEDDFDVWLAQDRHYLPVQMRFSARGRLITLSAIAIRVVGLHSAL